MIKGRAFKFGNDINTDDIIAAKYLVTTSAKELGSHCMESIRADFVSKIKKGDIIVAGENFGCGSSREHAPLAIKGAGISCVIAKSFARIFYRNAINIGLPILQIAQAFEIKEGDSLEIDLEKGLIFNKKRKKQYQAEKFEGFMKELVASGGLMNWIKKR